MWLFTRSSCFAPSASNFSLVDPHLSECGVYIVIIVSLSIYMSLSNSILVCSDLLPSIELAEYPQSLSASI
jgi:hypothetical protein